MKVHRPRPASRFSVPRRPAKLAGGCCIEARCRAATPPMSSTAREAGQSKRGLVRQIRCTGAVPVDLHLCEEVVPHDLGHEVADREDDGIDPPAFADHCLYNIIGNCRVYRHARQRLLDNRAQQLAVLILVYLTPVADSDERGRKGPACTGTAHNSERRERHGNADAGDPSPGPSLRTR